MSKQKAAKVELVIHCTAFAFIICFKTNKFGFCNVLVILQFLNLIKTFLNFSKLFLYRSNEFNLFGFLKDWDLTNLNWDSAALSPNLCSSWTIINKTSFRPVSRLLWGLVLKPGYCCCDCKITKEKKCQNAK